MLTELISEQKQKLFAHFNQTNYPAKLYSFIFVIILQKFIYSLTH